MSTNISITMYFYTVDASKNNLILGKSWKPIEIFYFNQIATVIERYPELETVKLLLVLRIPIQKSANVM